MIPSSHCVALLFVTCFSWRAQSESVVAGFTITTPPKFYPTGSPERWQREQCSWGVCGNGCLDQGAFCCNPGGTLVGPTWICDNGECITSVLGNTGWVDCLDPDNPKGSIQSCIDNVATTSCAKTEKCYTCETDSPYCWFQTWFPSTGTDSLMWFDCLTSKRVTDGTFYQASFTVPTSTSISSSSSSSLSLSSTSSTSSTSSSSTSSSSRKSSTSATTVSASTASSTTKSKPLSTGAIAGIAAGGGAALIAFLIFLWWFIKKRQSIPYAPPMTQPVHPTELPSPSPLYYQTAPMEPWKFSSGEEMQAVMDMQGSRGPSRGASSQGLELRDDQEQDRF